MAKWGEGDARWRVEDLGVTGRNVNSWHWEEKDAMQWSKDRLTELLGGITLAENDGTVVTAATTLQLDGEAIINQRKGKLIPIYELNMKIGWEGTCGEDEGKGEVNAPYISEENHDEDPELLVTVTGGGAVADKMRVLIVDLGRPLIHKALATFVQELRAGGPMRGFTPPQQPPNGTSPATVGPAAAPAVAPATAPAAPPPAASKPAKPPKTTGHTIEMTESFYASEKDIYECFTDPRRIQAYTQSPAEADVRPGGRLAMFGGSIEATFQVTWPGQRLEMDWRFDSWADGVFSHVVLEITEKVRGTTEVKLTQTGVPEKDKYGNEQVVATTEAGWRDRIFMAIKRTFGYGI